MTALILYLLIVVVPKIAYVLLFIGGALITRFVLIKLYEDTLENIDNKREFRFFLLAVLFILLSILVPTKYEVVTILIGSSLSGEEVGKLPNNIIKSINEYLEE